MNKDEEYHKVDGKLVKIPVQCHTCAYYVYFNGTNKVCTKQNGDGLLGYACVSCGDVCDKWEWCGY